MSKVPEVRISDWLKPIPKINPISGHEWVEYRHQGFVVQGGVFTRTKFKTVKSAEREKGIVESLLVKFPFSIPRSEREIEKAKKLNLPLE
jgi:hypothetical protein